MEKPILIDPETDHKIIAFVNSKNRIYLSCGTSPENIEDFEYNGFITLDKSEANILINELNRLIKTMK